MRTTDESKDLAERALNALRRVLRDGEHVSVLAFRVYAVIVLDALDDSVRKNAEGYFAVRARRLANELRAGRPSISAAVTELKEAGLIEIDDQDLSNWTFARPVWSAPGVEGSTVSVRHIPEEA